MPKRQARLEARRREARIVGAVGFLLASALPFVLFHRVIAITFSGFELNVRYVMGIMPWILMGLGLLFFVPVAVSAGRVPESRLYPRSRNAYAGWGASLYILGLALASQVDQLVLGTRAY